MAFLAGGFVATATADGAEPQWSGTVQLVSATSLSDYEDRYETSVQLTGNTVSGSDGAETAGSYEASMEATTYGCSPRQRIAHEEGRGPGTFVLHAYHLPDGGVRFGESNITMFPTTATDYYCPGGEVAGTSDHLVSPFIRIDCIGTLPPNRSYHWVGVSDASECRSEGRSITITYDLRARCPDGSVPDQEWRCAGDTTPPEEIPCTTPRTDSFGWKAKIPLRFAPDLHFFDFYATVDYCTGTGDGATAPMILDVAEEGNVRGGPKGFILGVFGFKPKLTESSSRVFPGDQTAEAKADFRMCWSTLTLIDKLKIKSFLEGRAKRVLTPRIARYLRENGGVKSDFGQAMIYAFEDLAFELRGRAKVIGEALKRLPHSLGMHLQHAVEKAINHAYERWVDWIIAADLNDFTDLTAEQIADKLLGELLDKTVGRLDICTGLAMWTPEVSMSVSRQGLSAVLDGYKHPALKLERVEVPVDVRIRGKQRITKKGALKVRAECPYEACLVEAGGTIAAPGKKRAASRPLARRAPRKLKLKPERRQLAAGQQATLKPRLSKRARRTLNRLPKRTKLRAKVYVRATDEAGNRHTERRAVRIRR